MMYAVELTQEHRHRIAELDGLRRELRTDIGRARPWTGLLRRQARAAAARSSVGIEGFHVSEEASIEIEARGDGSDDPHRQAFAGYVLAMQHVAVLAGDPRFRWSDRVILDLHFEACAAFPGAWPGRLRDGSMVVTGAGGGVAYRAPDAAEASRLLDELVAWLDADDPCQPVAVRAALAHLNLVSIHPFRDGNGRISRILQSLVLARDGVLAPELGSIEEQLARDPSAYYAALSAVRSEWDPCVDAGSWVTFCLEAHRVQALERIQMVRAAAARWDALEVLVASRGWPERLVMALERAVAGGADRGAYAAEAQISLPTASTDLRRLLDAGFVQVRGRTRNARYHATEELLEIVAQR